VLILHHIPQENHGVAKMTARCAQYMSALKIVDYVSAKSADDCARIATL